MKHSLDLPVRRIVLVLASIVVALFLLALIAPVMRFGLGIEYARGLVPFLDNMFDLNREFTPAAWFSSMLLLFSGLLLVYIGFVARSIPGSYSRHWLILGCVFFFLSLDETAAIHERAHNLNEIFGLGGVFTFGWVLLAIPLLVVLAVAYRRFLFALPSRTRNLFILSGTIYVGGALGFELIQGYYFDAMGDEFWNSPLKPLLTYPEEVMEMGGMVLFIYALLDYIRTHFGQIAISLGPTTPASVPFKAVNERDALSTGGKR